MKNKIFLFPLSLAVIFFSSMIIIFSPISKKNIIKISPTSPPISWQTYINDQYGFEFQYPSNWIKEDESTNNVCFNSPETHFQPAETGYDTDLCVSVSQNINGVINPYTTPSVTYEDLNDYYNKTSTNPAIEYQWSGLITINNNNGYKYVSCGHGCYFGIIIENNKGIYNIEFITAFNESKLTDIQKQILSTFKFLPDTSTWKTYKNTEYGFEFKYPPYFNIVYTTSDNPKYLFTLSSPKIEYIKSPLDTDIVSMGTEYRLSFDNEKCDAWNDNFGIYGFGSFQKIFIDSNQANVSYDGPSQNTYLTNIELNQGCLSVSGQYGVDTIDNSKFEYDQILSTFKFTDNNISTKCTTNNDCPSTSFCDYSLPGGMGPNGFVAGEPYGSQKCILKCQSDDQCLGGQCQNFEITTGDIVVTYKGCKP